jgi:hypothetical protein
VVKNANGMQIPLNDKVISLTKAQIEILQLNKATEQDVDKMKSKIEQLKSKGFKFLTLKGEILLDYRFQDPRDRYRFGTGTTQWLHSIDGEDWLVALYIPALVMAPVDVVTETGKQVLNIISWPIKSVVNALKLGSQKRKLKKLNKRLDKIRNVLNQGSDLSLVGKSESLNEKDYNDLIQDLNTILGVTFLAQQEPKKIEPIKLQNYRCQLATISCSDNGGRYGTYYQASSMDEAVQVCQARAKAKSELFCKVTTEN